LCRVVQGASPRSRQRTVGHDRARLARHEPRHQGDPLTSDSTFCNPSGSWAIVTGASDGIGRQMARDLARRGMSLVLVARRDAALQELKQELESRHATACVAVTADLGTSDGRRRVIDATSDLDVGLLVAAAGFGSSGYFIAGSLDAEHEMLAVNCDA